MVDAYGLVKLVHVLLAVVAVGSNATYGIWIGRARRNPAALPHVLRTVKFIDDRIANPAYALLLLSGAALVELGNWAWSTAWILAALVLWVVMAAVGLGLFTPALRKQIELLDRYGSTSDAYRTAAARATLFGILAAVPALAIVVLMVTKPYFG